MSRSDKRSEILAAALQLFAEHGFHGTPTSTIAKQAGVAVGTLFCYFENKDLLITELFRELEARLTLAMMEGYSSREPVRERFRRLATTILRHFIENTYDFKYLEQFFHSPYGVAFRRDRFMGSGEERDVFRELFEDGISQQVMKDMPLVVLYALAFGPLLAVARDHILGFVRLDDHLIGIMADACWDSLKR